MRTAGDLRRTALGTCVLLAACGTLTGCGGAPGRAAGALPQGSDPVELDPANFTVDITNRWWPMAPGDRWVYEETDTDGAAQRVDVTVLDETRRTAIGVEARVVHDVVSQGGAVVEDTHDWYAQDSDGNVWYLGEDTTEYHNGVASTEGSWESGVDGAQPGILLPAAPRPGSTYRQEYLAGQAEDRALVLSTREMVEVPAGSWSGALLTRETTAVEPDVEELKFYAPGVGPVLELTVAGGTDRDALVETTRGG